MYWKSTCWFWKEAKKLFFFNLNGVNHGFMPIVLVAVPSIQLWNKNYNFYFILY
jgi:hypothetical protein